MCIRDRSYVGEARVEGTDNAQALTDQLLEDAQDALTTSVSGGTFITTLQTEAAAVSGDVGAAFAAVTVDETATLSAIAESTASFVVTTPVPTPMPVGGGGGGGGGDSGGAMIIIIIVVVLVVVLGAAGAAFFVMNKGGGGVQVKPVHATSP